MKRSSPAPVQLWSNQFEFYVGTGGAGNRLEVSDGGGLITSNAYIGGVSSRLFRPATTQSW